VVYITFRRSMDPTSSRGEGLLGSPRSTPPRNLN